MVAARCAGPPAERHVMSHPANIRPRPTAPLVDPRSTGAPPRPRVADILGVRGTLKS